MIRKLLWIGLVASVIFFFRQSAKFREAGVRNIEDYEFATAREARQIQSSWEDASLIPVVKTTIHYDFAFILIYFLLMIGCSNDQMTQERSPFVSNVLRLNIALALIAALLDVSENLILLFNVESLSRHISTYWISLAKFFLAGWIAGLWMFSKIKTAIDQNAKLKAVLQ